MISNVVEQTVPVGKVVALQYGQSSLTDILVHNNGVFSNREQGEWVLLIDEKFSKDLQGKRRSKLGKSFGYYRKDFSR